MAGPVVLDIFLLGLKNPSAEGWRTVLATLVDLTGKPEADLRKAVSQASEPLFSGLDRDRATEVVQALEGAGARLEIRPGKAPEPEIDIIELAVPEATQDCPSCGFANPAGTEDCQRCGVVFAKLERETLQDMARERRLEEALNKAQQIRDEWVAKAQKYLETHPLPPDATAPFARTLAQDEIPFLRLKSTDGPLLLTSRRLLFQRGGLVDSIPFELIRDVDVGGGLAQLVARVKMQLVFQTPIPLPSGTHKSLTWSLDKESGFAREVVVDWAFARNFLCGSCGGRDVQYRTEGSGVHMRCMRCATDHEVDLNEALAIPLE
jgi:hypothetical protein